jgi:hypothetical protein
MKHQELIAGEVIPLERGLANWTVLRAAPELIKGKRVLSGSSAGLALLITTLPQIYNARAYLIRQPHGLTKLTAGKVG